MGDTIFVVQVEYNNGAPYPEEPCDCGTYYHGIYKTKEDAQKAIRDIFDLAKDKANKLNKFYKFEEVDSYTFLFGHRLDSYQVDISILEVELGRCLYENEEDVYWLRT